LHLHELGQKSKVADFLLTLKSIIISKQGYPLQNSSLGQPHSEGSVVSIVHSSAGKLLLEYFQLVGYARLDIMQGTKWFLSQWNKKKSQGLRSRE
jgi:hypothetical protein